MRALENIRLQESKDRGSLSFEAPFVLHDHLAIDVIARDWQEGVTKFTKGKMENANVQDQE